jgi:hypothetical protein
MDGRAENNGLEELCRITLTYLKDNYKDFHVGVSELMEGETTGPMPTGRPGPP